MAGLLRELREVTSIDYNSLAVHCHDTYGQALANVLVALNVGTLFQFFLMHFSFFLFLNAHLLLQKKSSLNYWSVLKNGS